MSNPFLMAFQRDSNTSAVSTNGSTFTAKNLPEGKTNSSMGSGGGNFTCVINTSSYSSSKQSYTYTNNVWTAGTLPKRQDPCLIATAPGVMHSTYSDGRATTVSVASAPMKPVVGTDANGNSVNMIMGSDGNAKTAGYEKSFGGITTDEYTNISVQTLFKSSEGVFATGVGTKLSSGAKNLLWKINSGNVTTYNRTISPASVYGNEYNSGKYLIANNSNVYQVNFDAVTAPSPVGGANATAPAFNPTSNVSIAVQSLNSNGTTILGYNSGVVGTWVPGSISINGTWNHELGQLYNAVTNTKATTYTFPGSAGTLQIQRVNALPNGDVPPVTWNEPETNANAEGYYGLLSPSFVIDWIETP